MAQVDDITQVERELEAFRARAHDALKSFDQLTELISEFTKTRHAYEAEVGNAAQIADLLKDRLNEIEQRWLQLKSEVDEAREVLSRSEIEREGRWVQYNKENKKAQDELRASWQEVQTRIEQLITDLTGVSEQHFAEVAQGFDLQASRLDDLQSEFERRLAVLEEDLAKTKKDLIAADRNLRTQLEQMVTDPRGDCEQRFGEMTEGLNSHASRLNDFQVAHGDLRTASWKMVDDFRGEAEGRLCEIDKSLARQAAKHEEANKAIEARISEANNRLAGELEASRQEYRKSLSICGQSDLVLERRIDKLQATIWALLAIAIIAMTLIIYMTY